MRICDCERAKDIPPPGLDELANEVHEWALRTFGPSTHEGLAAHILEEAIELNEMPTDLEEEADILIILFHKRTRKELVAAVMAKMDKNYRRRWKKPDARGVVNHEEGT